jgi:hypothetical protein
MRHQPVGHQADDPRLLRREIVEQRQPHQTCADVVGDGQTARKAPPLQAGGRGVQRNVVEGGENLVLRHMLDKGIAVSPVTHEQVVHVAIVAAILGDDRSSDTAGGFERRERRVVGLPYVQPDIGQSLNLLQLGKQIGGCDLFGQI